jgi:hypothetical protein
MGSIPKSVEEDKYWISFGQTMINQTFEILDDRAKFMITTCASLLVADFAVLVITANIGIFSMSPQFFFAISSLFFMISLFPRKRTINPWTPDETKGLYEELTNTKYKYHKAGFLFFFLALVSIAFSSISIIFNSPTHVPLQWYNTTGFFR